MTAVWASHHEALCSDGVVAPHGFAPLISSDLLMAVLWTFRRPSMCRQVHSELTHNELHNLGIVSKPVQKLVGRLTLFQGISQVLSHRKTT